MLMEELKSQRMILLLLHSPTNEQIENIYTFNIIISVSGLKQAKIDSTTEVLTSLVMHFLDQGMKPQRKVP